MEETVVLPGEKVQHSRKHCHECDGRFPYNTKETRRTSGFVVEKMVHSKAKEAAVSRGLGAAPPFEVIRPLSAFV